MRSERQRNQTDEDLPCVLRLDDSSPHRLRERTRNLGVCELGDVAPSAEGLNRFGPNSCLGLPFDAGADEDGSVENDASDCHGPGE